MKYPGNSIVITGISVMTPECENFSELKAFFEDDKKVQSKVDLMVDLSNAEEYVNPFKIGKMSKATVLSIMAAKQAVADSCLSQDNLTDSGIVIGSAFSALDKVVSFYNLAVTSGGTRIKPNLFANSVSCAPSGEVSVELGLIGTSFMVCRGNLSAIDAIYKGYDILTNTKSPPYLLSGGVDVYFDGLEKFCPDNRQGRKFFREGVGVFMLEHKKNALLRDAHIYGELEIMTGHDFTEKNNDPDFKEKTVVISNSPDYNPDIDLFNYQGATGAIGISMACALLESKMFPVLQNREINHVTQCFVFVRGTKNDNIGILIKKSN